MKRFRLEGDSPAAVFGLDALSATTPVRSSFLVPKRAKQAMQMDMVESGYGLKGKSRWMANTLEEFLDEEYWASVHSNRDAWKRIIVESELIRIPDPVKDFVLLDPRLREKALKAAIDAAYYGAHQKEPVVLDLGVPAVLRSALIWRVGTTRR